MKTTIVVKLTPRMAARVVKTAKARGVTKSEVVRTAIERDLSNDQDPLADLSDIVGSVKGPGDLSTNKKYLRGYGADR